VALAISRNPWKLISKNRVKLLLLLDWQRRRAIPNIKAFYAD
jgi:hypothetical protein